MFKCICTYSTAENILNICTQTYNLYIYINIHTYCFASALCFIVSMLSVYTGISNSMDHEQRPYLWHVWQVGAWKLDSCTVNRLFIDDFAINTFSRRRSEGFLFSFLVWGWGTVCGSFSCRGALIVSSHCLLGKWKKVMCCDMWKRISHGRRGWPSSERCFATL
jgi:hypothetical protein